MLQYPSFPLCHPNPIPDSTVAQGLCALTFELWTGAPTWKGLVKEGVNSEDGRAEEVPEDLT